MSRGAIKTNSSFSTGLISKFRPDTGIVTNPMSIVLSSIALAISAVLPVVTVISRAGSAVRNSLRIGGSRKMHAVLRDTMVVTMIEAGIKPNVIPGDAKAIVNARLLPGTTTDRMIAEIKRVIGDPDIEVSIVTSMSQKEARDYYLMRTGVPASPVNTVLYDALERNAKRLWKDVVLVPTMFEAGTDATAWRERNIPVYGIYPYPLDDDILSRMHGNDERIGVHAIHQGTEWIYDTLLEITKK